MVLLDSKIRKQLEKYPLYSQDGKGKSALCVCKFFLGDYTWYITEFDGEDTLFGVTVNSYGPEFGYISLNELQTIKAKPFGFEVERDLYFKPTELENIDDKQLQDFLKEMYE